jgi:hypothetical protein
LSLSAQSPLELRLRVPRYTVQKNGAKFVHVKTFFSAIRFTRRVTKHSFSTNGSPAPMTSTFCRK